MNLQGAIHQLKSLPVHFQYQVLEYIEFVVSKHQKEVEQNRKAILALAGSWNELSEKDFDEYLEVAHQTGRDLFNSAIEL